MVGGDSRAVPFGGWGFFTETDLDTPAEGAAEDTFVVGADSTLVTGGRAKASSARACVMRLLRTASPLGSAVGGGDWPNSNFAPLSCSSENSSREGKRAASSSAAALLTCTFWESRAAKGSEAVPLIGDGLGLAPCGCCTGAVGLPLLIGAISGMCCTC